MIAKIFSLVFLMSFFFNSDVLVAEAKTYSTKNYNKVFSTGLKKPSKDDNKKYVSVPLATDLPKTFDWRLQVPGGLSEAFDQKNCGSCWINAILGQLQDVMLLKYPLNSKIYFARQESVSCDRKNSGCQGGWYSAWDYIKENGISDESQFPYQARNLRCPDGLTPLKKIKDWFYVGAGENSEPTIEELKTALVYFGPLTFTVNASFGNYSSGVFNNCNRGRTNHMVLAVGYTEDAWIIKNSWGTDWGTEGGYIYIQMLNSKNLKCNRIGENASAIILE
jgi:C1A family cysteine protease